MKGMTERKSHWQNILIICN